MKICELTEKEVIDYLKEDDLDYNDMRLLHIMMDAAKAYIKNQTGINEEELNAHDDLTVAFLVLVQDMHDNRRLYVDNQNVNKVVDSIIYQYSENLL